MVTVDNSLSQSRCEQLLAVWIRAQLSVAVAHLIVLAEPVSVVAIRLRVLESDCVARHLLVHSHQCD